MRWFKSAMYGLTELLGTQPCQPTEQAEAGMEDVRDAMIHLLDGVRNKQSAMAALRVYRAPDAEALWFLRTELLAALSSEYGEQEAQRLLRRITGMLETLIPEGWHSRPSPLVEA